MCRHFAARDHRLRLPALQVARPVADNPADTTTPLI